MEHAVSRKRLALCELDILRAILETRKLNDEKPKEIQAFLADFAAPQLSQKSNLALHQAARVGDLVGVQKLIAMGANVNEKDLFKSTPLHMAAMYGHKAVAEYLIQHGANINAKTYKMDNYALTPLDLAAQYSPNIEMFNYLFLKDAEPEHWDILMFSLLEKVVNSYERRDFDAFDLNLHKIEIASENKNALWVYTDMEVKPIWLLHKVFASEIKDTQYYNRIIETINILYANDKNSLVKHYIVAKNLFHAFPSDDAYYYKIGPNKVKLTASGYYAIITVELAANSIAAFQEQLSDKQDFSGYQFIKEQYPTSDKFILQNVDNFTQQKNEIFKHLESTFRQAAEVANKSGLYEISEAQFNRYEHGETILISSGWDGHALDIILDKSLNLFMVANAGERFEGLESGLNAFNMQFALTADDLYLMLTNEEEVELEFRKFYDLGLEPNDTYSFIFPQQVYGNCAWYSQQIAQKALIFTELLKSISDPLLAMSITDLWFNEYTQFHQTQVLKAYLEDPFLELTALGDILKNYHMDLVSHHEKERAKLLLDHLMDSNHKIEFETYCKANQIEVGKTFENLLHNTAFETLSIHEVISWDNDVIAETVAAPASYLPIVLPVFTQPEEQFIHIM